jgi:hypothetical protein
MIALFHNNYRNPNGTITLTEHLVKMFSQMGEEARIYRIREHPGKPKPISTFGGTTAYEITLEEALEISYANPSLITHFMHKKTDVELGYAVELIAKTSCPFIIHDPRGFAKDVLDVASTVQAMIVFIRPSNRIKFKNDYTCDARTTFLLHPYIRHDISEKSQQYRAVSISRIGREKKIEIICGANRLLPESKKIAIFGAESDRLYTHFTLDKEYPEWREYYLKEPQKYDIDSYELCCMSQYTVDMTEFKGDGGGSQYTFLEAMDADSALILNSHWVNYPGEMKEHYNCMIAGNSEELAHIVQHKPEDLPGYDKTLSLHSTRAVGENWLKVCYEK